MTESDEARSVRDRYGRRAGPADRYAFTNAAVYMAVQERERLLVDWLTRWSGFDAVAERHLLEIGCGAGANLAQMIKLGFQPADIAVGVNYSDSSGTPAPQGVGRYNGFPIWRGHAARGAILHRIRHRWEHTP